MISSVELEMSAAARVANCPEILGTVPKSQLPGRYNLAQLSVLG